MGGDVLQVVFDLQWHRFHAFFEDEGGTPVLHATVLPFELVSQHLHGLGVVAELAGVLQHERRFPAVVPHGDVGFAGRGFVFEGRPQRFELGQPDFLVFGVNSVKNDQILTI